MLLAFFVGVDVMIPIRGAVSGDSQILCFVCAPQYLAMNSIF